MKNTKNTFIWVIIILLVIITGYIFVSLDSERSSDKYQLADIGTRANIDLPMFGEESYDKYISNRSQDTEVMDNKFISEIVAGEDSKRDAFNYLINRAWDYVYANNASKALKLCNEAWLIDSNNHNVYWCFGAILHIKNDFKGASDYFDIAISNYSENSELYTDDYLPLYKDASGAYLDLSDNYLEKDQANAKKYANKALDLLTKSLNDAKIPKKIVATEKLMTAFAHYNIGNYAESKRIYDDLYNNYPETSLDLNMKDLDKALKQKGF